MYSVHCRSTIWHICSRDGGALEGVERAGAVRLGERAHRLTVGAAGGRGGGAGEERIGRVGDGPGWVAPGASADVTGNGYADGSG